MAAEQRILSAVLACAVLSAQNPPPKTDTPDATFRSRVNLVLVPVVVRDRGGQAVANLTRDDFELFDKGKRQALSSFSVVVRSAEKHKDEPAEAAPQSRREQNSKATALSLSALPRRYVVYVFDDLNGRIGQITAVRESALRHFRTSMSAEERVAIETFSGRVALKFTNDERRIEETVAKLHVQASFGHGPTAPCPDINYFLADLILNRNDERAWEAVTQQTMECAHVTHDMAKAKAESAARQQLLVGEQDTRVSLGAVRKAIRELAEMPGQRAVVLASAGFFAQSPEAMRDVAGIFDAAARANVVVNTLDTRGVYTTGLMEASRRSNMSSLEQQYYRLAARADADVLADIAAGSGGVFFHNNNDLTVGFERVAATPEFSYVLGFSPQSIEANGGFHTLKVRVRGRQGLTIQARRGYYAWKEPDAVELAADEIHQAVFSEEERGGIPVDIATQVSKSGDADATLMVAAKVHLASLRLSRIGGRNRGVLTIVSAVFDADGGYVTGNSKTVNLALYDATLARTNPGLNIQSDFQMKPGSYSVRVVVRDSMGDAIAAHSVKVTVR